MFLDIMVLALLVLALIKGLKQGLVVAALSFAAVFVGLAAALKLSTWVAGWLGNTVNIAATWLPFLAFIVIMVAVFISVRILGAVLEQALELSLLGWANKLGGFILYVLLYITVFSVIIFYAEKMQLLKPEAVAASNSYPYIHFWGPYSVEALGKIIPFFKDMFTDLTNFFGSINKNIT
jgi:membrane protein required for colicin V production